MGRIERTVQEAFVPASGPTSAGVHTKLDGECLDAISICLCLPRSHMFCQHVTYDRSGEEE